MKLSFFCVLLPVFVLSCAYETPSVSVTVTGKVIDESTSQAITEFSIAVMPGKPLKGLIGHTAAFPRNSSGYCDSNGVMRGDGAFYSREVEHFTKIANTQGAFSVRVGFGSPKEGDATAFVLSEGYAPAQLTFNIPVGSTQVDVGIIRLKGKVVSPK